MTTLEGLERVLTSIVLGLWAMRTPAEVDEVCRIYNLNPETARRYVQFGEVFNLLHAGASYLRTWQKGYGAVGVSEKYGKRSFARKSSRSFTQPILYLFHGPLRSLKYCRGLRP